MKKEQMISRWHIVKTKLEKLGANVRLDLLAPHQLSVLVMSSQDLSEMIEWGFTAWDDVKSCFQSQDDHARYFSITFKPDKSFNVDGEDD